MDGDFDYLIKFLVLGNSGVGKTSFLHQYSSQNFDRKFSPTIGIDFTVKKLIYRIHGRDRRLCLQLWDTAGQERYRSLATAYYRETMGFLLLFDLTNEQSFVDIRYWLDQLKLNAYCDSPDVILCGNKLDLTGERLVEEEVAKQLASRYRLQYLETSAATGHNVELSIAVLLESVVRRIESTTNISSLNSGFQQNYSPKNGGNSKICNCY